jgi:hypothetical protein
MAPKFSLGIAMGFVAGIIWKNRPYRSALQQLTLNNDPPQRDVPPVLPTTIPELPETIDRRIAAIEGHLDQADRVILDQSRAAAAKAFRPPTKAATAAPLKARMALAERQIEVLRRETSEYPASLDTAASALREQVKTWSRNLPTLVQEQFEAASAADALPEIELPLPHPASEEPPNAGPRSSPVPPGIMTKLSERLAAQSSAIDNLANNAANRRSRLDR